MEILPHERYTKSVRPQNYQGIFNQVIHRIEKTEKILHEQVDQEIKSLIMKQTQVQITTKK